jgi:hypothetical protein
MKRERPQATRTEWKLRARQGHTVCNVLTLLVV